MQMNRCIFTAVAVIEQNFITLNKSSCCVVVPIIQINLKATKVAAQMCFFFFFLIFDFTVK